MQLIDEFFSAPPTKTLYHYTGIKGLLGIVNCRSVWASHAYYLSDTSEIRHAVGVFRSALTEAAEVFSGTDVEFLRQAGNWLSTFDVVPHGVFVFSLSERRNLLSQWRSYTPHGKGVSVGFSSHTVRSIVARAGFRLAKCIYELDEHQFLVTTLVGRLLDSFHQQVDSLDTSHLAPSQSYFGFLESYRGDLLQILAIIKHPKFREEEEWRIVSPYFARYTVPEIRFREGASMLVPYIALPLPPVESLELLFDEVVLGPSQDVELSIHALANFLSNRGVCNVVTQSQIPYRQW